MSGEEEMCAASRPQWMLAVVLSDGRALETEGEKGTGGGEGEGEGEGEGGGEREERDGGENSHNIKQPVVLVSSHIYPNLLSLVSLSQVPHSVPCFCSSEGVGHSDSMVTFAMVTAHLSWPTSSLFLSNSISSLRDTPCGLREGGREGV